MSQTRNSQRSIKRPNYNIPNEEDDENMDLEHLVKDAALHILAMEHQKSITKDLDLRKQLHINDQHKFRTIMQTVDEEFQNTLGLRLVHVDGKTFPVSKLSVYPSTYSTITADDDVKRGLLTLVLTTIFMYENNTPSCLMKEDMLWEKLAVLNIEKTRDPNLGDVSKLLSRPSGEFLRQGWLSCKKHKFEDKDNKEAYVYEWGVRAKATVDAVELLKWHCEMDGSNIEDWENHLKKARMMRQEMKDIQTSKIKQFTE